MDIFQHIDQQIFIALNSGAGIPWLDFFMLTVTNKWTWLILGAMLLVWTLARKERRLFGFCLVVGLTLGAVDFLNYEVLKPAFSRPRPCYQLTDVRLVQGSCGSDYGFPSNHAANAAVTVVALQMTRRKRLARSALGLALLVGFSRIYLGVHYPGDILAGFLFGGMFTWVVFRMTLRFTGPWIGGQQPSEAQDSTN